MSWTNIFYTQARCVNKTWKIARPQLTKCFKVLLKQNSFLFRFSHGTILLSASCDPLLKRSLPQLKQLCWRVEPVRLGSTFCNRKKSLLLFLIFSKAILHLLYFRLKWWKHTWKTRGVAGVVQVKLRTETVAVAWQRTCTASIWLGKILIAGKKNRTKRLLLHTLKRSWLPNQSCPHFSPPLMSTPFSFVTSTQTSSFPVETGPYILPTKIFRLYRFF